MQYEFTLIRVKLRSGWGSPTLDCKWIKTIKTKFFFKKRQNEKIQNNYRNKERNLMEKGTTEGFVIKK